MAGLKNDANDKLVAVRLWGVLLRRMSPLQVSVLERIHDVCPTGRELADHFDISIAQATNVATLLFRDGLVGRERSGRSYRYFPAFTAPLPFHYFDCSPVMLDGYAAEWAAAILRGRAPERLAMSPLAKKAHEIEDAPGETVEDAEEIARLLGRPSSE